MKPFSVPGLAPFGGCQGFSSTSLPRLASIRRPKYDASWRAAGSSDEDQRIFHSAFFTTLQYKLTSQTCTKRSRKWKITTVKNCSEVVQLVAQRTLTPLILVRVQASEPTSNTWLSLGIK
jgi:hypothetical protein